MSKELGFYLRPSSYILISVQNQAQPRAQGRLSLNPS